MNYNCYFCGEEIEGFDSIVNTIRVPSSIQLFNNIQFDTINCCMNCKLRYDKTRFVFEYFIIKFFRLVFKVYHKLKHLSKVRKERQKYYD